MKQKTAAPKVTQPPVGAEGGKSGDPKYTPVAVGHNLTKLMMNWNEVIKKENKSSQIYEHFDINPHNRSLGLKSLHYYRKA